VYVSHVVISDKLVISQPRLAENTTHSAELFTMDETLYNTAGQEVTDEINQ